MSNQIKAIVTLHCGALFESTDDPEKLREHFREIAVENGRDPSHLRIVTHDDEGGITTPTTPEGRKADCLYGCPCKRKAKRKEEVCWPSEDDDKAPRRRVVSCAISSIMPVAAVDAEEERVR